MDDKIEGCLMPLWDYVVLEYAKDEKALIIRPENADKLKIGTLELKVLFVGPDCVNIRSGDRLLFNPAQGRVFSFNGKEYYSVRECEAAVTVAAIRRLEKSSLERLP